MVRSAIIAFFVSSMLLAGCSLKVVPQAVEFGTINQADKSQTVTKDGLAITVKNSDAEMINYNLDTPVTSFAVTVENLSSGEVAFARDGFLLVDSAGQQYSTLTPEKLRQMISKESYYLLPYPYVGFYYLEDYERAYSNATINSQQPYFYEVYPQDIYTKAFPDEAIIPKAKVSGLVYFAISLTDKTGIKLLMYKKGSSKSSPPDFSFPFSIQK